MPAAVDKQQQYCSKCNRTKNVKEFYKTNNLEKYPSGWLNQCKNCITMHVDNWDPETYLWILQECDVPYVPKEWNALLRTWCKDRSKVTGLTVMGRYLSKMKLKQYKDFRWKDTEHLQEMESLKLKEAMQEQGYSAADIDTAIYKATVNVPEEVEVPKDYFQIGTNEEPPSIDEILGNLVPPPNASKTQQQQQQQYAPPPQITDYFDSICEAPEDTSIVDALTDEDKMYLRMKWGKTYRPDEWVWLEKLYNDMIESYDIQQAGHLDTLKLVCKTSLKSNQLLDAGDVEGAQKMIRMYDSLMKSGKFTASQNKAESGEAVDSVGEIVALCEKDGFIPRFYVDKPQDKVDRTIQDFQEYVRSLVMEEMNLGNLIEQAVKQIQEDKVKEAQRDADSADEEESFENELFDKENLDMLMKDEDYQEFYNLVDENTEDDEEYLASLIDNEELI